MVIIDRIIEKQIIKSLIPNKVIVLVGPRRVGKTVLINQIIKTLNESHLLLSGEDFRTLNLLEKRSIQNYRNLP